METLLSPDLVDCARAALRLTEGACARAFRSANPEAPPIWEGRFKCFGCPAGAARAGVVLDPQFSVRQELGAVCPRCCRFSDRLIGKRLCVSCYNRERELRRGENRKGHFPARTAAKLYAVRVAALVGDRPETIRRDLCSGPIELALSRARTAKVPFALGWAPLDEAAA